MKYSMAEAAEAVVCSIILRIIQFNILIKSQKLTSYWKFEVKTTDKTELTSKVYKIWKSKQKQMSLT